MLESLDAAAVRRWCAAGLDALRRHQVEIDQLNVYPVPDGDTGTNLVLTVTSAWHALLAEPDAEPGSDVARARPDGGDSAVDIDASAAALEHELMRLGQVLRCMARGALLGARGNSGVIISQILRGTADALAVAPDARGRALARALTVAAQAGYAAVARPVEGTVLTVAGAAATAATQADSDDLATVVRAAAAGAAQALERTPQQLPALARAGVVDAGGRGLVVLLDALVEVVTGEAVALAPLARVVHDPGLLAPERESGSAEFEYEVQYLLDAPTAAVESVRAELAGLGDSLVIVGTGDPDPLPGDATTPSPTWNVHVHVNDIGAAIESGVRAGRPYGIRVTRFADQMPPFARPSTEHTDVDPADALAASAAEPAGRGLVVVAAGVGLAELFEGEGAVVVAGGPTNNPSTGEVLAAISATGARRVVVLPNDSNVAAVAAVAAAEARTTGVTVSVIGTRSPVQALAALAVTDPRRRFDDDIIAMAEAVGACRYAEVTTASRAALTVAGRCEAGDILALVEGEVNVIGQDLARTCVTVLDRMLSGGGELVTLVLGATAPDDLGEALATHLGVDWPFVEVQIYSGGQPHYPLLIGVE